jgi:glycosyltransferase involved in cell wall biosynthesis
MDKNPVLLSICCITYNHENYISQAIEGFLAQKTSFNFEIIIHDDASTDATASIVKKYEQEHPNLIKAIYQTENQYSKGIKPWPNFVFPIARGKYIALCEGDDYWTDPYKLQKQVDYLEANPEYNLTCHRYQTYNETTKTLTEDGNEVCFTAGNEDGLTFDALYIFRRWISKTLTVVFRNDHNYSSLLSQYQYARDVHLFYHILKNGKGFFFPFIGGVYRVHDGGVFSASSQMDKLTKGSLIFREIAEKNPDFQPVYQGHIDNVINKIDGNIFAHRFPFLKKENYILILHLYSVCNKRKTAIHRFGKLFLSIPQKITNKIKSKIMKLQVNL